MIVPQRKEANLRGTTPGPERECCFVVLVLEVATSLSCYQCSGNTCPCAIAALETATHLSQINLEPYPLRGTPTSRPFEPIHDSVLPESDSVGRAIIQSFAQKPRN